MRMDFGQIRTSDEDRLNAILGECEYLLELPMSEDDAQDQIQEFANHVERVYVGRWGRWHEERYGTAYLADEARVYARHYLRGLIQVEETKARQELEDREAGTLEDDLPDALLEEFVASSEESQRVYLGEQKLFDAYVSGVRSALSMGWDEAQEVARLWELSQERVALSHGRQL